MTGMPMSAIVLPAGTGRGHATARMSASKARQAPQTMLPGMIHRCEALEVSHLLICGAIIPTKPMGPQKAVAAPVTRQQLAMDMNLMREVEAPESSE